MLSNIETSSIRKNAILNIVFTVTNMIFPLITYPYVTRILSSAGMGKVSFFASISNYAVMVSSLGISTYGIRAVAKVRDNKIELSKVFSELLVLNTIITVIVVALLIISIPFVNKFNVEPMLFFINLLIVVASPFGLTWLYSGLEQYAYITKRNLVFKGISLLFVFLLVRDDQDYLVYAALTAFSTIGSYICNLIYSRKFVKLRISKRLKFKYHLKPMMYLFASILAVSVYTNLDTIMLGFINGDDAVGYYSVASKVKWLLLAAVNAISAVLLPRLSNYVGNNEIEKYNAALKKSVSFIFIITIPLSMFFILEAPDGITLLGGSGYEPAIVCMQFLMPILIISGFSNVTGNQVLIPNGKDSYFMRAVVIGAAVDIVLNIILMPAMAATGAAIATLIAELTQMSIQFYYSRKEIIGNLNVRSLMNALAGGIVSGVVVVIIRRIIQINAFINLLFTAVLYFGIYGIFLFLAKEKCMLEIIYEIKMKIVKK